MRVGNVPHRADVTPARWEGGERRLSCAPVKASPAAAPQISVPTTSRSDIQALPLRRSAPPEQGWANPALKDRACTQEIWSDAALQEKDGGAKLQPRLVPPATGCST